MAEDIRWLWSLSGQDISVITRSLAARGSNFSFRHCDKSDDCFSRSDSIYVPTDTMAAKFFEYGGCFVLRFIGLPMRFMVDLMAGTVEYRGERMPVPADPSFLQEEGCQDVLDFYHAYTDFFVHT